MNPTKNNILVIAGALLLVLLLGLSISSNFKEKAASKQLMKLYKTEIEALKKNIDSLQRDNKALEIKVTEFEEQRKVLDDKIYSLKNEVRLLKNKSNEAVNLVDYYSDRKLVEFFTERYKEGYNIHTTP